MVLLLGSGCIRSSVPGTAPSLRLTPGALLSQVEAASSRLIDLKGLALVSATLDDRRGRVGTRILFRHPDHLKILIDGPFGQILGVIALNGETVQVYLPLQNTVFEGSIGEQFDGAIPGWPVRLSDIRTSVIGLIDLTPYGRARLLESRQEGDQYILTMQADAERTTRTVWIDAARLVVIREEEERGAGRRIVRTFEHYIRTKGIWRPSRVRIASEETQEAVTVQFQTQTVNTGLSAADLALVLPKTVKRLPLSRAAIQEHVDAFKR